MLSHLQWQIDQHSAEFPLELSALPVASASNRESPRLIDFRLLLRECVSMAFWLIVSLCPFEIISGGQLIRFPLDLYRQPGNYAQLVKRFVSIGLSLR